ncbi:MAG: hypothetical protein H7A25_00790 [Leptospiraceae bacterium]|nr:hypothetical protein [Leptospiraceae bacterium]
MKKIVAILLSLTFLFAGAISAKTEKQLRDERKGKIAKEKSKRKSDERKAKSKAARDKKAQAKKNKKK